MSEWLFEGIKVGDQVVFNGMCLKTVCYVSDTCFDVGSTRFRKRDGKPVKARCPAKLDPVSPEWIQYLKEEYGISVNENKQPEIITLNLPREKAENCHEMLGDVLHWGPSETLEWLREQIEEALK